MTLQEISEATGGILNMDSAATIDRISTDTREIANNSLYVALKGNRFDGHDFIEQALEEGAVAAVSEKPIHSHKPVVLVRDTKEALGRIASHYQSKFRLLTVAVTGSVGKTSTKEMIYEILKTSYCVHKTQGNFNNDIGLPKTLLGLQSKHTACILEMGMSERGEISYLSKLSKPDIAVITGIGVSHIETLGSKENILSAKLEILDGMSPHAKIILNGDDPLLRNAAAMFPQNAVLYGITSEDAAVRADNMIQIGETTAFDVVYQQRCYPAVLPMVGMHNISNALAGFAVGVQAGIAPEQITQAMGLYQNAGMRQKLSEHDGIKIIADCYNASPDSMRAAFDVISRTPCRGKRVAVLGDMLELGNQSAQLHRETGRLISQSSIDVVVCVGTDAKHIAEEVEKSAAQAVYFQSKQQTVQYLKQHLQPGDAVIFKASRGVQLEQVIHQLFDQQDASVMNASS